MSVTTVFGRGGNVKATNYDYSQAQIRGNELPNLGLSGATMLVDFAALKTRAVSINMDTLTPQISFKFQPGLCDYDIQFVQTLPSGGSVPTLINADGGLIFVPDGDWSFCTTQYQFDIVRITGQAGLGPSWASMIKKLVRQAGM